MNPTIERLADAMNRHDADGMAALLAPDYRSEQPAHPHRGFSGGEQLAKNWREIFIGVPDLTAKVVATSTDASMSWSEWAWTGHHADGAPFGMCGVIVAGLADDGRIRWARLYMEPIEHGGAAIDETVAQLSSGAGKNAER